MDSNLALDRPVYLTREGGLFRLVFDYDKDLVERCHQLYYATYDGTAWYAEVCAQNVETLRSWFSEAGLTDVSVDELVAPDEVLAKAAPARLRPGRASRPYSVELGSRVEGLYQRLHSLPGAKWEKASHSLTYPALASVALAEMVKRGVIDDPGRLLTPADLTVAFDGRSGKFSIRGDERAGVAFARLFPNRDVVAVWKEKGFDVAFADAFSEEVYRGELARVGEGLQPEGFKISLFPYQARNVAVGVERNGIGVLDSPGLGKCSVYGTNVWVNGQLSQIGKLWDLLATAPVPDGVGEWAVPGVDLVVHAVDFNGAMTNVKASRLYRQEVDEALREVTLDDGSSITVTAAHKLLTSQGWTNGYQVGQRVALPKRVDWEGEVLDPDVVNFLAWQIAEGDETGAQLRMTQHDEAVLEELRSTFLELADRYGFEPGKPRIADNTLHVRQEGWRRTLEQWGYDYGQLSASKSIPAFIQRGDKAALRLFLSRYFSAEGLVAPDDGVIKISSASPLLMEQLKMMLRRFGVWLRTSVTTEAVGSGGSKRPYTTGLITGESLRTFTEEVGFSDPKKQAKAQALCVKACRTNLEIADQLQDVTGADLHWATVKAVTDVFHKGYVYDLEVPEHHNYVANGIMTHNTATAIAWGHELMVNRQEATRTVVVVPGAVRTQWAREIARFTGIETDKKGMPLTGVTVIDGDKKKRTKLYEEAKDSQWVILNYDLLALDFKMISPLVAGSLLVADEAHRLKSPTAKRTKAMRDLAARASRRMALSGTPVENNPGEWYNVLSGFAVPGVFGSPTEFLSRYQYPNRWGGYEGARNLGELRERSRVHYVRHTKAEVATHLPPLRVQHTPIDPEPAYMSALKRAHREARDEIAQAAQDRAGRYLDPFDAEAWEEVQTGADMTAVGMLRLLCLSPRLVVESDSESARALCESGLVPEVDGPKLDELRTMAGEMQAAGERLVVFTFSKKMADLISSRLSEDGIRHVTFTGADSSAARDDAVLAFTTAPTEEDPGPTVFVATDAGAEGLNLGKQCSTLLNLDIPWTPGRFEQRSNRIHRLDGTAPHYLVRNMTLKGTLEEGILRMVEQKADLVDAIFGEAGGRTRTTGRPGRSVFEEALSEWGED